MKTTCWPNMRYLLQSHLAPCLIKQKSLLVGWIVFVIALIIVFIATDSIGAESNIPDYNMIEFNVSFNMDCLVKATQRALQNR